ncbi:DUF6922 domain-containing protein [Patescibacteria group bacterium]
MIKLNKQLFWDVDYKKLDYKKHAGFIIEKVITYGDMDDWEVIKKIYGIKKIKNAVKNISCLDKKSLNFWSQIFNIPKNSFKCANKLSIKKQSPFLNR